jgi:hypothetical protein
MWALPYIIDPVRRGGVESMQFSMGLRPEGVLVAEYEAVFYSDGKRPGGAAHNNIAKYTDQVRGGVAGIGWFARVATGEGRAMRFNYVITDKGMVHLSKRLAALTGTAEVKPAKAKPVKVARKRNAKAAPVTEAPVAPEVETPQVDDTSLPATTESLAALAAHFSK